MATTLQFRRGSTATLSSITGSNAELFVDTDKKTIVVMDGSTAGGYPLARASDLSSYATTSALTSGLAAKQATLVSGTNIKTINGTSVLGSGDITVTSTETDPVFTASAAGGIDSTDISHWDTAYGWGDHSVAGYLTSASLSGYATESYVGTQIANLVDSAPATLDTLNELAAALGDDENFASTVTTSLSGKQETLVSGTNIKTITGTSLLGSGDISISGGSGDTGDYTFTDNIITLPETTDMVVVTSGQQDSTVTYTADVDYSYMSSPVLTTHFMYGSTYSGAAVYYNQYDTENPLRQSLLALQPGDQVTCVNYYDSTSVTVTVTDTPFVEAPSYVVVPIQTGAFAIQSAMSSITMGSIEIVEHELQFTQDGDLIVDSAIVGNLMLTDDIITPVTFDSYGNASAGSTLTINGDLEVTGTIITSTPFGSTIVPAGLGSDRATALSEGKILEVNKKYFIDSEFGGTVILPDATDLSSGDTVEVFYYDPYGMTDLWIWCYGPASGSPGQSMGKSHYLDALVDDVTQQDDYDGIALSRYGAKLTFILRRSDGMMNTRKWFVTY
jgi:hypothetical protein